MYNAAIPSSAPVEKLFSFGSVVLYARRGHLSDANFEKLMFLKNNSKTFKFQRKKRVKKKSTNRSCI